MALYKGIPNSLGPANPGAVDAFGRTRVSSPQAIFDSKQIFDNQPLFWDDAEVSGSNTTSTYDINQASSILGVGTDAGVRTRRTFMRFNYQPGKGQLIQMTGVMDLSGGGTGITRSIGYGDDDNGLFFVDKEGTLNVRVRSKTSGSVVNTDFARADWDDSMDGNGPSRINIDFSMGQIFQIDFEWLGIGDIRFGFVINNKVEYCHVVHNSNSLSLPYMSTPNLPIEFRIENDGTGAASTLRHQCATVLSEGGAENLGNLQYESTDGVHVAAAVADTIYAIIGLQLKSDMFGAGIDIEEITTLSESNGAYEWILLFNPTVASTFTYGDKTNSALQTAIGVAANTVTGGTPVSGGFASGRLASAFRIQNARRLGASIAAVADTLVLCLRPLANNQNVQGTITWRELT